MQKSVPALGQRPKSTELVEKLLTNLRACETREEATTNIYEIGPSLREDGLPLKAKALNDILALLTLDKKQDHDQDEQVKDRFAVFNYFDALGLLPSQIPANDFAVLLQLFSRPPELAPNEEQDVVYTKIRLLCSPRLNYDDVTNLISIVRNADLQVKLVQHALCEDLKGTMSPKQAVRFFQDVKLPSHTLTRGIPGKLASAFSVADLLIIKSVFDTRNEGKDPVLRNHEFFSFMQHVCYSKKIQLPTEKDWVRIGESCPQSFVDEWKQRLKGT